MILTELTKEKIKLMSFEQALSALDEIVSSQSRGDISLEDSIKMYEIGIELKMICESYLNNARMRVEKLSFSKDGIKKEEFK